MKLRLSATEYMMIDIPQEVNKQEFYGLIKRMSKYQKFFTDGDVFSLKEEKDQTKQEQPQPNTRKPYSKSLITPIIINKEKSKKEMKFYYSATIQERKDRAKELELTFKDYGIKVNYIKRKWKFTPKEVGVPTLNLGHK